MDILVTGGTGKLGRALVERLRGDGRAPRVLSRTAGQGRVVGDLRTGAGIDDAVRGADVIVHCATAPRGDADTTRTLVDAAARAGSPHLVYVSIVGIETVPMPYYRAKLAAEKIVTGSGLPWTILRATQFHDLLATMFSAGSRTGVLPVLKATPFQPVDVTDVAARLAKLALEPAAGRADDFGGPQVRDMADLGRAWLAATGTRRRVVALRLPGAIARGYRTGAHTAPEHTDGTVTFEQFLGTS
ncbi:MAG: NAD(P)H-binding protein [Pseudonocardia sp.]|uniref:SDR family oxidoreductase n=1 Tax=unclassified Pseudonocardia TaxID=2619320 RepID=UPI000869BF92|nr:MULTISPECIES: NAD(P)H-binding protein [unclassified Pseudonocardia]MBN9110615.1 NAD(P)H-binding protein [Pseudonocardia sp.]ODU24304.1 MAG: NmrA family transcriptional regulator [Pseudonocardia sp. SCN 72-51]ODV04336.1 MAG: NmrA family transcriptional regulator [Pseudonocardia sp. SCN 73-27]